MNLISRLKRAYIKASFWLRRIIGIQGNIPVIDIVGPSEGFTPLQVNPLITPVVKTIAFYLPQFHPFKENDDWWGKGFTEWSNVGKATPNFQGHTQPHCPIHLGYYDLRLPQNMVEQARLAKAYGLHGFCYYFYWFDGKVLMHEPLEAMIENPDVDTPFCLMWANENWSRRWDGREDDILIAQKHSTQDSLAFIRHLEKYFRDDRYIKVKGKPVLLVYRAKLIPDIAATAELWRQEAKRMGFPDLYLVAALSHDIHTPEPFQFDAAVQFPPHPIQYKDHASEVKVTNPKFTGWIYSYQEAVKGFVTQPQVPYRLFRTAMLSWDNTARKQDASLIFNGFNLATYQQWLSHNVNSTLCDDQLADDERFTFINAWNEWAEGTHLEPDRNYGYGYLQSTYDVLREYDIDRLRDLSKNGLVKQRNDCAVIVHLHYVELFSAMAKQLKQAFPLNDFDLYITVTSSEAISSIRDCFPLADIRLVENRGRDILPFIETYRRIHDVGYLSICKLHAKRSVYRPDGERLHSELTHALVGSANATDKIRQRFRTTPRLGMVVPKKYLLSVTRRNTISNITHLEWLEQLTHVPYGYHNFAAGSMFWFRPRSLDAVLAVQPSHFDLERGLADGTLPHAIERMFCTWIRATDCGIETC